MYNKMLFTVLQITLKVRVPVVCVTSAVAHMNIESYSMTFIQFYIPRNLLRLWRGK